MPFNLRKFLYLAVLFGAYEEMKERAAANLNTRKEEIDISYEILMRKQDPDFIRASYCFRCMMCLAAGFMPPAPPVSEIERFSYKNIIRIINIIIIIIKLITIIIILFFLFSL